MNKKLPKVFVVPMNKEIRNNKDIFLSSEKRSINEEKIIHPNEINKLFNAKDHVYKTRVLLKTLNEQKEVDIIGLKNDNLLTLDGKIIPIKEIQEIKKVS